MGFKFGIVGLPNVGKSTLFNALTKAGIEAANFPFCTIEPNISIVPVPDSRLDQLSKIVKPRCIIPTTMEFIDIAGLVKGASKGRGLGNKFLDNIRNTEAIGHVVRCFKNENIIHITNKLDPVEDINIINTELILSDLNICERAIHRIYNKTKNIDRNIAKFELEVLKKCLFQLENNNGMLSSLKLSKEERELIRYLNFLTLKPILYIANVSENGFENNPYLDKVRVVADNNSSVVLPVCALLEADIIGLNDEERNIFIADLGPEKFNLNRLINTGYNLLNLQTYFTVGAKEVRAWTIPIGTTAIQAASKIHTDFKRGFIRVQAISFEDFIIYNGEQGAKEAGKIRSEGKDYIIKDGDILNFLFNV